MLFVRLPPVTAEPPSTNIVIEVEALTLIPITTRPDSTLLKNVPDLLLRDQGSGSPQTDLSIRGGPFNSSGLLLNGLTLRNCQTEHWQADIPMPDVWFAPPLVLTGLDRFCTAPGHPSGSVSLDLVPITDTRRSITTGTGNKDLFFGKLFASQILVMDHATAGISGFLSYDRADQTDGYSDNYLNRTTVGGRIGAVNDALQADLITTHAWRTFGARSFYGLDPKYPAEEQLRDTLVAGSLKWTELPVSPSRLTAAWRRTDDTYWLDRNNHAFYENNHIADFFAVHGDYRQIICDSLSVDLRGDADLETINSLSLGNHTRSHTSLAVLPNYTINRLTLTLGGSFDLFSSDTPAWLPAAGLKLAINDEHSIFLSYTEAVRQPSYTELNYNSPSSLGNNGLARQQTQTSELGWLGQADRLSWKTTLFYEKGQNIVDWVKTTSSSTKWNSVNLATLRTWGFAANGNLLLTSNTDASLDIIALTKTCDTDFYASRYAMDYPDITTRASLRHRVTRDLRLSLHQGVSTYHANAVRKHDDLFLNTGADLQWHLPHLNNITINAGAENLLNDNFQTYAGQESAGRRFFISLSYVW